MTRKEKSKRHQALREAGPSWWQRPAVLIFIAAFLVNANTLTHSWALDDTLLITQNKLTQQGFSAIPEIWGSDVFTGYFGKGGIELGGRYRPLSQTVFAICHGIFGPSPFVGHLLNVGLYALTCALLFVLLRRIFPERSGTSRSSPRCCMRCIRCTWRWWRTSRASTRSWRWASPCLRHGLLCGPRKDSGHGTRC
jgi:hypothetical protein